MSQLIDISKATDILPEYCQTPIGRLLEYHNLQRRFDVYEKAKLIIGMCMDNRKRLQIPRNFAYIIRTGGANLRNNEFHVAYAVSVGEIQHIALIGHNNCGMVNLDSRKEQFIKGLAGNAGWDKRKAEEYFTNFAPEFEIRNETGFILSEAKWLRQRYPKICVAPMLYKVEDNRLYLINEKENAG